MGKCISWRNHSDNEGNFNDLRVQWIASNFEFEMTRRLIDRFFPSFQFLRGMPEGARAKDSNRCSFIIIYEFRWSSSTFTMNQSTSVQILLKRIRSNCKNIPLVRQVDIWYDYASYLQSGKVASISVRDVDSFSCFSSTP